VLNYNTLEMVLLASACLICLSGIMFESNQLGGGTNDSITAEVMTWCVLLIILASMVYWVVVFIHDLRTAYFLAGEKGLQRKVQRKKEGKDGARIGACIERMCPCFGRQSRMRKSTVTKPTVMTMENPMVAATSRSSEEDVFGGNAGGAQFFSNPMMQKKAREDETRILEGPELAPDAVPEEVPTNHLYRQYVAEFRRMERELQESVEAQKKSRMAAELSVGGRGGGGGAGAAARKVRRKSSIFQAMSATFKRRHERQASVDSLNTHGGSGGESDTNPAVAVMGAVPEGTS
jgi:hypothetical protein